MVYENVFEKFRGEKDHFGRIKDGDISKMQISQEECDAANLPLGTRDYCAHLLIPLRKCRLENHYMPWTCKKEKHIYEKCQYDMFQTRLRDIDSWRQEKLTQLAEERESSYSK